MLGRLLTALGSFFRFRGCFVGFWLDETVLEANFWAAIEQLSTLRFIIRDVNSRRKFLIDLFCMRHQNMIREKCQKESQEKDL